KEKEEREWEALLPQGNRAVFLELSKKLGDKDLAGTSVWCAVETMKKAMNSNQVGLEISKIADQAVLFLAKVDDVEKFIVSLPVDFSGQEKRVVSFVVGNSEQLNFSSIESENEKEHMGKNLIEKDEDVYSYIGVGPDGQEMFVERIMLTFNDASNLRRSMDYSQYAFLMGKLRELPLRSEAERINRQFLSGQWGMITNNSEIFVYDDITALDILEGRAWLSKISGSEGSTMEIMYEWYKINEDRAPYLIAKGTLNATWVRIIDHGVVKVEPFPSYLQQLMDRMAPKSNNINNNYEKDKNELLLNCKFKNSNMLTDKIILYKEQFKTSYQNSNIVGNIYYANYYLWQSQIKDNYFSINFSNSSLTWSYTSRAFILTADI
ncbi:hypothetical protein HN924_00510, partial [Candidatus Woesearchaeota archaeon]|nr:hypothetical protein [Candidatus Woesearchaeota archaeon]